MAMVVEITQISIRFSHVKVYTFSLPLFSSSPVLLPSLKQLKTHFGRFGRSNGGGDGESAAATQNSQTSSLFLSTFPIQTGKCLHIFSSSDRPMLSMTTMVVVVVVYGWNADAIYIRWKKCLFTFPTTAPVELSLTHSLSFNHSQKIHTYTRPATDFFSHRESPKSNAIGEWRMDQEEQEKKSHLRWRSLFYGVCSYVAIGNRVAVSFLFSSWKIDRRTYVCL